MITTMSSLPVPPEELPIIGRKFTMRFALAGTTGAMHPTVPSMRSPQSPAYVTRRLSLQEVITSLRAGTTQVRVAEEGDESRQSLADMLGEPTRYRLGVHSVTTELQSVREQSLSGYASNSPKGVSGTMHSCFWGRLRACPYHQGNMKMSTLRGLGSASERGRLRL